MAVQFTKGDRVRFKKVCEKKRKTGPNDYETLWSALAGDEGEVFLPESQYGKVGVTHDRHQGRDEGLWVKPDDLEKVGIGGSVEASVPPPVSRGLSGSTPAGTGYPDKRIYVTRVECLEHGIVVCVRQINSQKDEEAIGYCKFDGNSHDPARDAYRRAREIVDPLMEIDVPQFDPKTPASIAIQEHKQPVPTGDKDLPF